MGQFIGTRADVGAGLYVAPSGINAETCGLSQLTFNVHDQAQIVLNGSYEFTGADVHGTDYYRKVINYSNMGIEPIATCCPNMNKDPFTYPGYNYRSDMQGGGFDIDNQYETQGVFKFKATATSLVVICSKADYTGFSYMVLNKGFSVEANVGSGNKRIVLKDGRLLISRAGHDVDNINADSALFDSDRPCLRGWSRQIVDIEKSDDGKYKTLTPISGVDNAAFILTMFRPKDGSKSYEITTGFNHIANGYMMGFCGSRWWANLDLGIWLRHKIGIEVHDIKNSGNVNVALFGNIKDVEVALAIFGNNLG